MTSFHHRRLEAEMRDPEFRAEYERTRRELAQVNAVMRELDAIRVEAGMSKAELARRIGKTDSSVRRLFSAEVNPELMTVVAIASALGTEIQVKPAGRRKSTPSGGISRKAATA